MTNYNWTFESSLAPMCSGNQQLHGGYSSAVDVITWQGIFKRAKPRFNITSLELKILDVSLNSMHCLYNVVFTGDGYIYGSHIPLLPINIAFNRAWFFSSHPFRSAEVFISERQK